MHMITKGINEGFSDVEIKQGIVSGYFAMFGNKDLDGDIIEKGAFAKTISERGPSGKGLIKYLLDHDKYKVVAKINELEEDSKGLRYVAKIGSHSLGQDFMKMVESGLINQHSFGFVPMKESYDQQSKANRIKEVMMLEGSAIQFLGANPETSMIELKNESQVFELIAKLEKFIKTSDASDETMQEIENKIKSLNELIKPTQVTLKEIEADNLNKVTEIIKNTFEKYGY
jgi:uncharacterized protein